MKLECAVIRDLHILYIENELSSEVKEAVEEHLIDCEECRKLYESKKSIEKILVEEDEKAPSLKFDEKMKLKLKVSRLKVIVLFVILTFCYALVSNYTQTRYNLINDIVLSRYTIFTKMHSKLDTFYNTKEVESLAEDIETLNTMQNSIIVRDLNFIEMDNLNQTMLGLNMSMKVNTLYDTLKTRYLNGVFTERDKKALKVFDQYLMDIYNSLISEEKKLTNNHTTDGKSILTIFKIADVKALANSYKKLNVFALTYTKYNKFPDEMKIMTSNELSNKINYDLGLTYNDIRIDLTDGNIILNGECGFGIKSGNTNYSGTIDPYTGIISEISLSGIPEKSNSITSKDIVKTNLNSLLEKIYGNDKIFKVQYKGINYNFGGNTDIKLYSFEIIPQVNGITVDYRLIIYYDSKTGILYSINKMGTDFNFKSRDVQTTSKISQDESLNSLNIADKSTYTYNETLIIKSKLTSNFVPVYVYKNKTGNLIYINTITGKQEFIYTNW